MFPPSWTLPLPSIPFHPSRFGRVINRGQAGWKLVWQFLIQLNKHLTQLKNYISRYLLKRNESICPDIAWAQIFTAVVLINPQTGNDINKRQTGVYPYFTTAKKEPKKFSSTTTWWVSKYGTEEREEKHKCVLYNFIFVEFWKWQNKSATESWSEVAWGWGAGCDCTMQEGAFWGKGYVL